MRRRSPGRPKNRPFLLFLCTLAPGHLSTILKTDDLIKLELPKEVQHMNILGVMAPKDTEFKSLFDDGAIRILSQAGGHDLCLLRYRNNMCSIEHPMSLYKFDFEKIWSFINRIIKNGL